MVTPMDPWSEFSIWTLTKLICFCLAYGWYHSYHKYYFGDVKVDGCSCIWFFWVFAFIFYLQISRSHSHHDPNSNNVSYLYLKPLGILSFWFWLIWGSIASALPGDCENKFNISIKMMYILFSSFRTISWVKCYLLTNWVLLSINWWS